jgi:hypothetical protein
MRKIGGLFRRTRVPTCTAPPAPRSLIYVLCEEYQQFDLWAAYYAFRLDPHARTWERLRDRRVPWRPHAEPVEALLHRLCPVNAKRTPDAATVGLALVSSSSTQPKKTAARAHTSRAKSRRLRQENA